MGLNPSSNRRSMHLFGLLKESEIVKKDLMIEPIKKEKLNDVIIRRLIKLIQDDLEYGDKLPSENELLQLLNIGRSSLREALRSVETMGLIEVRAGAGSFVTKTRGSFYRKSLEFGLFDYDHSLEDIIEARRIIEVAIIDSVVVNVTNEQLEEMERAVKTMEEVVPPDLERMLEADVHFHELLNAATGNTILHELLGLVYNIAGKVRNEYFESPQDYSNSARYHRSILEALKKRDQGAARMAMTDHMNWVKKVFLG